MAKKNAFNPPRGSIEVICGPMFAGKSEELLRRLNRLQYADVDYILFKPYVDTRTVGTAKSRDGRQQNAVTVKRSAEILEVLEKNKNKDVAVVAVDEAQFFDDRLGEVCEHLANQGHLVYVAGLDLDFRGVPFKSLLNVFAFADKVTKLTAICTECGAPATRTQRIIDGKPASYHSPVVKIGNVETYSARCREHHIVKDRPKAK
ncbi:MAG: thymidine kinase [Mycoplasmataceae bacterium]|jgi:thymidine kinase|nr:thymidine kinase [Mycoplasmataceae bacterium]